MGHYGCNDTKEGIRQMTNKQAAVQIVKRLRGAGFQALLAGGCVRDMLLRQTAKRLRRRHRRKTRRRYETISPNPQGRRKIRRRRRPYRQNQVEVATFRTESDYADGRHPSKVRFATPAKTPPEGTSQSTRCSMTPSPKR